MKLSLNKRSVFVNVILLTDSIVCLLPPEAVARVLPGPEVYVQTGSRLEVICQVEGCTTNALLSWTRSGHPVLTSEVISYNVVNQNVTSPVAELLLAHSHATPAHSGTYTCTSTCTKPINVTVHVLRGKKEINFTLFFFF